MKILQGAELQGYIKERQAKQVRALRQAHGVFPKLAIIVTVDDPVIAKYVSLKQVYGEDVLVEVDLHTVAQNDAAARIAQLNADDTVHGIILQLPLAHPEDTDALIATIAPQKDIDGLRTDSPYIAATAQAIDWLLAGYNVSLKDQKIVIVGNGRLVGRPLAALWQAAKLDVIVCDETTLDVPSVVKQANIIVSAAGVPGLITSAMVRPGAVVVDAGTAAEGGKIVGDVAPSVRDRSDITITPETGGVGPLTIASLFDNLLQAARSAGESNERQ